jgi:hypothetical protein
MAWTAPATWIVGQVVTAAELNELSGNLNYVKARLGGNQWLWLPVTTNYLILGGIGWHTPWGVINDDSGGSDTWIRYPVGYSEYRVSGDYQDSFMCGVMPPNFGALTQAIVVYLPPNTAINQTHLVSVEYAAPGEAYNTHTDNHTFTLSTTSLQFGAMDISSYVGSLAANDVLGVKVIGIGGSIYRLGILGTFLAWS